MRLIPGFQSIALMLMLSLSGSLLASATNVRIEYDQQQDRIRVQANNASLTLVLAQIAKKTGMTIQIDPAVEKTVSFQLPPQSLQQALQKICKGLSYVIEYKTDAKQQTVVSGMKLLPEGKQDSGQLVSVSVLNARAGQGGRGQEPNNRILMNTAVNGSTLNRPSRGVHKSKRPTTRQKIYTSDGLAE